MFRIATDAVRPTYSVAARQASKITNRDQIDTNRYFCCFFLFIKLDVVSFFGERRSQKSVEELKELVRITQFCGHFQNRFISVGLKKYMVIYGQYFNRLCTSHKMTAMIFALSSSPEISWRKVVPIQLKLNLLLDWKIRITKATMRPHKIHLLFLYRANY